MSENLEKYAGKNCLVFNYCEVEDEIRKQKGKSLSKSKKFSCKKKDYRECDKYNLWMGDLTA